MWGVSMCYICVGKGTQVGALLRLELGFRVRIIVLGLGLRL